MARQPTPIEVQVTMPDGTVHDFKSSLGDKIVMNEVDTYVKDIPPRKVKYYTLMITPTCESKEG